MGKKTKRLYRQNRKSKPKTAVPPPPPVEDPRSRADRIMHEFDLLALTADSSNKFDIEERRMDLLSDYDDIVRDEMERHRPIEDFLTAIDYKFLKKIWKSNDEEMSRVRYWAMDTWEMIKRYNFLFEEAVPCLLECTKIPPLVAKKCDRLDEIQRECQGVLDATRAASFTLLKDNGANGEKETVVVPIFGGDKCEVCDFTESDADNIILLRCCGGCKLTYYCSRKCQKIDRERHRKVCRKRGEFQPGDWAACPHGVTIYDGTASSTEHRFVQIVGRAASWSPCKNDDQESQQTKHICFNVSDGWGNTTIIPAKNLRNLRPALWGIPVGFSQELFC